MKTIELKFGGAGNFAPIEFKKESFRNWIIDNKEEIKKLVKISSFLEKEGENSVYKLNDQFVMIVTKAEDGACIESNEGHVVPAFIRKIFLSGPVDKYADILNWYYQNSIPDTAEYIR